MTHELERDHNFGKAPGARDGLVACYDISQLHGRIPREISLVFGTAGEIGVVHLWWLQVAGDGHNSIVPSRNGEGVDSYPFCGHTKGSGNAAALGADHDVQQAAYTRA